MDNIACLALKPVEILCQNPFLFIIVDILGEMQSVFYKLYYLSLQKYVCVSVCVCDKWSGRKVKC